MPKIALTLDGLSVGYGGDPVLHDLSLRIPQGRVTAFCGPNGCGKSTALKAMRGMLGSASGSVMLDKKPFGDWSTKELAREIAMLGQTPNAPEEMFVRELVGLGRYAYRSRLGGLSQADREAIEAAIQAADLAGLAELPLGVLSGGQAQRAWLAMVLAQEAPIIFLDEPTNHLDISHALATLDLVRKLSHEDGKTVLVVLHDLNLAASFADEIAFFKAGRLRAMGRVEDVFTEKQLSEVFEIGCKIIKDGKEGHPVFVPYLER